MGHANYIFSDHIFLVICLMGQIQTKIYVAQLASRGANYLKIRLRIWVVLGVAWLLILMLLYDSLVTSMYYHTVQASWTTFVFGVPVFEVIAIWWINQLSQSCSAS